MWWRCFCNGAAKAWSLQRTAAIYSPAAGRGGRTPTAGGGYPAGGHRATARGRKAVQAATAEGGENVRGTRVSGAAGESADTSAASLGRYRGNAPTQPPLGGLERSGACPGGVERGGFVGGRDAAKREGMAAVGAAGGGVPIATARYIRGADGVAQRRRPAEVDTS